MKKQILLPLFAIIFALVSCSDDSDSTSDSSTKPNTPESLFGIWKLQSSTDGEGYTAYSNYYYVFCFNSDMTYEIEQCYDEGTVYAHDFGTWSFDGTKLEFTNSILNDIGYSLEGEFVIKDNYWTVTEDDETACLFRITDREDVSIDSTALLGYWKLDSMKVLQGDTYVPYTDSYTIGWLYKSDGTVISIRDSMVNSEMHAAAQYNWWMQNGTEIVYSDGGKDDVLRLDEDRRIVRYTETVNGKTTVYLQYTTLQKDAPNYYITESYRSKEYSRSDFVGIWVCIYDEYNAQNRGYYVYNTDGSGKYLYLDEEGYCTEYLPIVWKIVGDRIQYSTIDGYILGAHENIAYFDDNILVTSWGGITNKVNKRVTALSDEFNINKNSLIGTWKSIRRSVIESETSVATPEEDTRLTFTFDENGNVHTVMTADGDSDGYDLTQTYTVDDRYITFSAEGWNTREVILLRTDRLSVRYKSSYDGKDYIVSFKKSN